MPDTAVAPSVGAGGNSEGAASPAPSGAEAQLSDEQIVGLESATADAPETAETAEAEAATEQPAETAAAEQPEQATPEETPKEDIPQDGRAIPAELREVFKANPKLRDTWFSERAYREVFPTVREAREMKEIFPGGIEDARLLRDASDTLRHLDGLYLSKSPESHQELARTLAELDPEAYPGFVMEAVNNWAAQNPEAYKQVMTQTILSELPGFLANEGLPNHIDALAQALQGGDTDRATQLTQQLRDWARLITDGRGKVPAAREADPEIAKLRAEIAARDQRDREQRETALRNDVTNRYVGEVKGFLEKAAPSASQRARDKMTGEIVNATTQVLTQSPAFVAQLNQLKASGNMNEAANFVMARAKQLLPQVGKRVLTEWTNEILAANKTAVQKKAAAANRSEVGAGASPSPVGTKPGKVDYTKMSDADILGM